MPKKVVTIVKLAFAVAKAIWQLIKQIKGMFKLKNNGRKTR